MSDQERSEDQDLQFTNDIRKQLVAAIVKDGKMPEDIKERSILLQTLDGIDRQALTKIKIKSDEGLNDKKLLAAAALAQLYMDPKSKVQAVEIFESMPTRETPQLGDHHVEPVILEGELDPAGQTETYTDFMKRTRDLVVAADPNDAA